MRDKIAEARDHAALERDEDAGVRDLMMAARDEGDAPFDRADAIPGADHAPRAVGPRTRAAELGGQAAESRAQAARDRRLGAQDRMLAAFERADARADREALAHQLDAADSDALTGARTTARGLADLVREIDRCHHTNRSLVAAYVDVVGLPALYDTVNAGVGDDLLASAVGLIRGHLRSYDLVIRLDHHEFLCAMAEVSLSGARERFNAIASDLASASESCAIRCGFAELSDGDTAAALVARADDQLVASRG